MTTQEYNLEVNKDDEPIGLRPRSDFYTGKFIHRACQLLLFNSKNELLLQKRAAEKEWYPNLLTFSASGTVANTTYEASILKEMEEEIGIQTSVNFLFKFPYFDTYNKAWHAVFKAKSDQPLHPDTSEIQALYWKSIPNLKEEIQTHPLRFTPPFRVAFKKYNESIKY